MQAANLENLPQHASIDWSTIKSRLTGGHVGPSAKVRCPYCKKRRWIAVRILRQQTAHPNYTGACRPCWNALPKARTFRTNRNPSGRSINTTGYITLGKNAIADCDLALFHTMRLNGGYVLEHRWVMAQHLGRPLTSNEMVDHMNGDKTDNSIGNLRMYVRGKQQPGSCPGHGTYYHEWQMAERRIRELGHLL